MIYHMASEEFEGLCFQEPGGLTCFMGTTCAELGKAAGDV